LAQSPENDLDIYIIHDRTVRYLTAVLEKNPLNLLTMTLAMKRHLTNVRHGFDIIERIVIKIDFFFAVKGNRRTSDRARTDNITNTYIMGNV